VLSQESCQKILGKPTSNSPCKSRKYYQKTTSFYRKSKTWERPWPLHLSPRVLLFQKDNNMVLGLNKRNIIEFSVMLKNQKIITRQCRYTACKHLLNHFVFKCFSTAPFPNAFKAKHVIAIFKNTKFSLWKIAFFPNLKNKIIHCSKDFALKSAYLGNVQIS